MNCFNMDVRNEAIQYESTLDVNLEVEVNSVIFSILRFNNSDQNGENL